ncbi:putative sporulation protein YtxC [Salsuginibacillus halophilus]|uniref:Putative sporulation protein YtxC n=1 Tax=Salsuginibacillus halophilus TaxID=517424 RepID=A0A2P8HCX5_9BACI|nr:sporulation protein YtxC [Salsuginibacillus halophilus]PSL44058.1 putative sporulation protein YtxC [Salsuginibacillus halophilus]
MVAIECKPLEDRRFIHGCLDGSVRRFREHGIDFGEVACKEDCISLAFSGAPREWEHGGVPLLSAIITDCIIATREDTCLKDMLQKKYQFDDVESISVLTIACSIIAGDRPGPVLNTSVAARKQLLFSEVKEQLEDRNTFHFEPFLTFRTSRYQQQLMIILEAAVEEYHLEQKYQLMIERMRHFLRTSAPVVETLTITGPKTWVYSDGAGRILSEHDRLVHLSSELMIEEGAAERELLISPIVSLAPKRLFLKQVEETPLVRTLMSIFQERLSWL